jgi:hypothetical protein
VIARLQPEKGDPTYRQIWRVVDGAVTTALAAHPEFLAPTARLRTVRNSIVKRVVGALHGYAAQAAWVRSASSAADDMGGPAVTRGTQEETAKVSSETGALLTSGSAGGGHCASSSRSHGEGSR